MVGDETIEDNNQPFIYIPKVGVFGALNVDDRIKIVTTTQAKAYEFEDKEIDARGKLCLMIYPSRINVNVELSDYTKLMSLQPPQWEKQVIEGQERLVVPASYKSIHYFNKITVEGDFRTFLYNLLTLKSPYLQVWLFETLTVVNPKTKGEIKYNHVMIFGRLPGDIYILTTYEKDCTAQSKISSIHSSFQDKESSLWTDITNLTFSKLVTPEDFKTIIENLGLKPEGVLANIVSIKPIFDALAEQTRKSTDVQEKGSLKRVLEAKKK
jgi:hypothetical protein